MWKNCCIFAYIRVTMPNNNEIKNNTQLLEKGSKDVIESYWAEKAKKEKEQSLFAELINSITKGKKIVITNSR
jgi:hypothetical protein